MTKTYIVPDGNWSELDIDTEELIQSLKEGVPLTYFGDSYDLTHVCAEASSAQK